MIIEYINGPNKGIQETIVGQIEEKGSPVYITESEKHLSINDLNRVFRILRDNNLGIVNLSELGDPSLLEIEQEFIESQQSQGKPKYEHIEVISNKPVSNVKESKNEVDLLGQLIEKSKKINHNINIPITISIPSKSFLTLIKDIIEVNEDDFINRIAIDLNIDIQETIKKELVKYYQTNKTKPKITI